MAATPKARLYKVITPPKPGGGITVEVGKSFTYGGGTEGMTTSVKAINRLGLTTNSIAIMVAQMNATFAESMKMQIQQQQELADQREEGVQKLVDQRKAEAEDIKQKEDLEQDLEGEAQQEGPPDPKEKKGFGYAAGAVVGAVSNAFGFFEGIAKFIGRIFRTMVTVAFLKWMGNPENLKKVEKVVQGVTRIGKWLLKIAGFLINMGLDGLTDFLENPLSFKGIFGIVKFLTAAAVFFAPAKMAALGMKGVMALFKGGKLFKLIGSMLKGLMGVFKGVLGFIMARPRAALMVGAGVLAAWGLKTLFGGKKEDESTEKKEFTGKEADAQIDLEKDMSTYLGNHGEDSFDHPEYIKMQIRMEELEGGDKDVIDALKQKLERIEGKDKKGKVKPKKIAKGGLNLFGNKEKPKNTQEKTEKTKKKNVKPIEKEFKIGRKTYDLSQPFAGLSDDEWTNYIGTRERNILSRNMRAYQNQPKMAAGGWISGPQSGYPVSLDGGRSTSFIGHGTEYVAQKKTGGAFVVPYDTPATRGNAGLTGRRTQEAANKGFSIPGFSAGGLIQDMAEGGPMAEMKGNMSMDELVEAAGPSLLAFMKQHNDLLDSDPEFYGEHTRLYMDRDGKMLNFGKTIANMSEWAFNEGNQMIIDNPSIDPEVKKLLLKKMDWVRRQTLDNPNFKSDIAFNLNKDIPGTAANRLYEKAKNSPGNIAIKAGIPPEEVARLWNRRGLSSGGHINLVNLSAGGMVPKAEPTGEYINVQAMSEGGEFDEGGGDSDGGVSIHKGDLAPIKMGKQADAGPPPPIFVDSKYEVPANDYFQTRYGLMAEGNTAPVEMF